MLFLRLHAATAAAMVLVPLAIARPAEAGYYQTLLDLSASSSEIVADGDSSITLSVTVTNGLGAPKSGHKVVFDADYYTYITPYIAYTNDSGVASATFKTIDEGTYSVYVRDGSDPNNEVAETITATAPGASTTYTLNTLLSLVFAVTLQATGTRPPSPKAADLATDQRLSRMINTPTETTYLASLIQEMHKVSGATLLVQGDLLKRPILIGARGRRCSELMRDLAVLFGGTWVSRDDAYILITEDIRLHLTGFKSTNLRARLLELVGTLNRGQWLLLQRKGELKVSQMLPVQQEMLRAVTREAYFLHPEKYPSSILMARECGLLFKPTLGVSAYAPTVSLEGRLTREMIATAEVTPP